MRPSRRQAAHERAAAVDLKLAARLRLERRDLGGEVAREGSSSHSAVSSDCDGTCLGEPLSLLAIGSSGSLNRGRWAEKMS